MRNSFKVGTIGGINIYVNYTWLIAVAFLTWSLGDYYATTFAGWSQGTAYVLGAVSAILLFVTVLIHELSHSFTARARGLPVHEITLFIFGGVSSLTREPDTPRTELLVAVAGPLASLALSGIFFLLHALTGGGPSEVSAVLGYLASVNLILALFNLVPGFPLDGGRVLRATVWQITGNFRRATRIATSAGQGIGYLFLIVGIVVAFVAGNIFSGIWLALIGWFLYNSASASYQQVAVDRLLMGVDVRDVMDRAPVSAPPTASVERLAQDYLLGNNRRAVLITDPDGRMRGIVALSDLKRVPREHWYTTPATEIMTPASEVRTVAPDEDLKTALRTLAEHNHHQLPVTVDGRVVGMLDRGQVLQYLHLRQQLADSH